MAQGEGAGISGQIDSSLPRNPVQSREEIDSRFFVAKNRGVGGIVGEKRAAAENLVGNMRAYLEEHIASGESYTSIAKGISMLSKGAITVNRLTVKRWAEDYDIQLGTRKPGPQVSVERRQKEAERVAERALGGPKQRAERLLGEVSLKEWFSKGIAEGKDAEDLAREIQNLSDGDVHVTRQTVAEWARDEGANMPHVPVSIEKREWLESMGKALGDSPETRIRSLISKGITDGQIATIINEAVGKEITDRDGVRNYRRHLKIEPGRPQTKNEPLDPKSEGMVRMVAQKDRAGGANKQAILANEKEIISRIRRELGIEDSINY
jgi:hypothetical protein